MAAVNELLSHVILIVGASIAVGLGVPALALLMRRLHPRGRVAASLILLALAAGVYGAVEVFLETTIAARLGPTGGEFLAASSLGVTLLLAVNAVLQLVEFALWDGLLRRRLHIEVPRLIVDLVNFVVLTATAILVIANVAGRAVEFTDVLFTSTVISAVLGLALQEVLGNVFAGLALQAEAPVRSGDWIRLGDHEGQVVQMGWRAITLRTRQNHAITIPNGTVARHELINYARPSRLQAVDQWVGFSYADPPARVKPALIEATRQVPGVRQVPAPVVYCEDYGDFAITYRLRFWITDWGRLPELKDAVFARIWYVARRRGLTIPFPIRDVRIARPPPAAHGEEVDWAAVLRGVSIFAPLNDAQVGDVAERTERRVYGPGEAIVEQGEEGESMYVVDEGRLRIEATTESGERVVLAERGPGDFFGEMSLLTGQPRNATVIAESESGLLRIDKAAFKEVLLADPDVAEALSEEVVRRATETESRLEDTERQRRGTDADAAGALLRNIRSFFGLEADRDIR